MRNLLIVILVAVVVWLLMERNRLTEELATSQTELANAQKKAEEAEKRVAALTAPRQGGSPAGQRPGSWLDPHLDRGAKALSTPQTDQGLKGAR